MRTAPQPFPHQKRAFVSPKRRHLALQFAFLFAFLRLPVHGQESAQVTGSLVVQIVEDLEGGRFSSVYAVRDETTGRFVALDFSGRQQPDFHVGARVSARGWLRQERLIVAEMVLLQPQATAVLPAAAMTGARRIVAILANLADATFGANCSVSKVASELFTAYESVAPFYQEASFGQLTFPGDTNLDGQPDVFGPFWIPDSTSDGEGYPPRFSWIQHAEEAATAAGINLNLYQHRVFVFPNAEGCYGLWGQLGCSSGTCYVGTCGWPAFIPQCVGAEIFAHEIGHNLGMNHASIDADNDGIIDPPDEYADASDVMGNHGLFHPNAAHKFQMGWFDAYPGSVLDLNLDAPGRPTFFRLSAVEYVPSSVVHPQVLRIAGDYYLSTRQAIGYDADLDSFSNVTSVHRLAPDGHTLLIATLADGQKLETPSFRLRQVAHDSDSVTVEIPIDAFPTFQITSVSPSGGSTLGGTAVMVRGYEFQPGAQLQIGGVPATGENVVDSTTITAITPSHAAGVVDVEVINPGPEATSKPNAFFYYPPTTLSFYTLTPCRLLDTRNTIGPHGGPALTGGATRAFTIAGQCGVPAAAKAISANITITGPAQPGHLEFFPTNAFAFGASTINFSAGQTRANNALLMLATDGTGRLSVANASTGSTHLILDVNGWFQ